MQCKPTWHRDDQGSPADIHPSLPSPARSLAIPCLDLARNPCRSWDPCCKELGAYLDPTLLRVPWYKWVGNPWEGGHLLLQSIQGR